MGFIQYLVSCLVIVTSVIITEAITQGPSQLRVVKEFSDQFPVSTAISKAGRTFLSFAHWDQNNGTSVVELRSKSRLVAFPNEKFNDVNNKSGFNNVHALMIDNDDRLWVLDTGKATNGVTENRRHHFFVYNLINDKLVRTYIFPDQVELPGSLLQDIRFDNEGYGYITDSGIPGLVVLNLKTGESYRRLHNHYSTKPNPNFHLTIDNTTLVNNGAPLQIPSNGIAISKDKLTVYFCPISSRSLYSIQTKYLLESAEIAAANVQLVVKDKGSATAGMMTDDKTGFIYMGGLETRTIYYYDPETTYFNKLAVDDRILWPDTMAVFNRELYVTVNQLNRRPLYQLDGKDKRVPPYMFIAVPL